ncbi:conjugative transfer signal peptidase TraF [Massilia sp. CT11-137]|uniref:conjugative transfer signal peptidase TraF n=1 Tax=Massilia sp. CT11-137 TaxID=3393901 RepID=UPI0039B08FD1
MKFTFRRSVVPRTAGQRLVRALGISASLLGVAGLFGLAGARVNTSRSIALGLYWTSERPARKGEYVLLCPPQVGAIEEARRRGYLAAGFCPGGYGYMMKRILATGGDAVTVDAVGVRVNDVMLPFSVPLVTDRAGRPMPRLRTSRYVLSASEVLLMSDVSTTSFDGRYFGPVSRAQIRTVIVPVLTW